MLLVLLSSAVRRVLPTGGNSTKKEGFTPAQIAAMENNDMIEINEAGKKCWKGYKKVGTQKTLR